MHDRDESWVLSGALAALSEGHEPDVPKAVELIRCVQIFCLVISLQ